MSFGSRDLSVFGRKDCRFGMTPFRQLAAGDRSVSQAIRRRVYD